MCKAYESTESIGGKRGRDRKPKKRLREDSMILRLALEKNDISSREIGRLDIESVSSNSSSYYQKLRVNKLYSMKKTIHIKIKHSNVLELYKRTSFEGFAILGHCFKVRRKRISDFWINKA
ncbi:hypothetical protein AVEN_269216-1 [Araneus ventricosus]|uniref:Uncharacterized protein n=1 Tax=Araneus ventricosus TaxID=182803 RepID=A0A4Y2I3I4_ARAVE|nr:hypothetical protein AVEN_269216-1 [Araneus ventricosus]